MSDEAKVMRRPDGTLLPGSVLPQRGKSTYGKVRALLDEHAEKAASLLIEALEAQKALVVKTARDESEIRYVDDWSVRLQAIAMLFDRIYGKAVTRISGEDGGPIKVGAEGGDYILEIFKKMAAKKTEQPLLTSVPVGDKEEK